MKTMELLYFYFVFGVWIYANWDGKERQVKFYSSNQRPLSLCCSWKVKHAHFCSQFYFLVCSGSLLIWLWIRKGLQQLLRAKTTSPRKSRSSKHYTIITKPSFKKRASWFSKHASFLNVEVRPKLVLTASRWAKRLQQREVDRTVSGKVYSWLGDKRASDQRIYSPIKGW